MSPKTMAILGALLAAAGVGLGAYGAHGLEGALRSAGYEADLLKRLAWFETGVRYQLYHALALVTLAALATSVQSGELRLASIAFVISVIPVVGEFAAAQQPVIVVLSEGTMMTVQAVVSDDRRYVRLTLVPFFSQIGDVQTFTFEGSESISTSNSNTDDNDGENTSEDETEERTRSGTTVQLPTFQVITVSTTVSVPDGGTVLLGGIKRLVEGRNEFGVPLLSKVPYIDRLFRNVGIGRETDSLMMMVTPHIIIQEEEEDRLGIAAE